MDAHCPTSHPRDASPPQLELTADCLSVIAPSAAEPARLVATAHTQLQIRNTVYNPMKESPSQLGGSSGVGGQGGESAGRGMQGEDRSAAGFGGEGGAPLLVRREHGERGGHVLRQGQSVGEDLGRGVGLGMGLDCSQSTGQGIGHGTVETLESADETGGVQCGQTGRIARGTPQMLNSQLTLSYGTHLTATTAASQLLRLDSGIQLSEQGATPGSGTQAGYRTQTAGAQASDSSQYVRSRSQPARDEPETVRSTMPESCSVCRP